jgi:hypothetical protein
MHSLTLVHTDLGKLPYVSGDGYAPASMMRACTARSMASVVTPGRTRLPAYASTSAARRPAARIFSMPAASCVWMPSSYGLVPVSTYGGSWMWAGTGRRGEMGWGLSRSGPGFLWVGGGWWWCGL